MFIIGLLFFLIVAFASRRLFSSYFNPLSIYCLVWGTTYVLYGIDLVDLPQPTFQTLLIPAMGHFAFVLGCTIPSLMNKIAQRQRMDHPPTAEVDNYDLSTVKKLFIVLIPLYMMRVFVGIKDILSFPGGFDTFFNRPWAIRNAIVAGYVPDYAGRGILLDLGGIGMTSLVIAGFMLAVSRRKSLLYFIPVLIAVADSTLETQRALAFTSLCYFIASTLYTGTIYLTSTTLGEQIRLRRFFPQAVFAAASAIIVLAGVISINERIFNKSYPYQTRTTDARISNPVIIGTYWYIVGGVAAFDERLQQYERPTMGIYTFGIVLTTLADLGIVDEKVLPPPFGAQIIIGSYSTNVYTFMYDFYQDFGVSGVLIMTFVLGLIMGYSYFSMRRHFTLTRLAWNSVLAMIILFSFATFIPHGRQPFLIVLSTFLVEQFLVRRRQPSVPIGTVE